jgi:N,N'-diacetylbacillosaminyl-diphospho-undecaprenol alpha-1,3-N-acetylgalactosaminyltransferase
MIIHFIHYPVSAKRFVEPLVAAAISEGFDAELWLEYRGNLANFISSISCPKQFVRFDLKPNFFAMVKDILFLKKKLRKISPGAFHCHQSRAPFIPLLSARLAKVPIRIYHNHGTPYLGYIGIKKWAFWLIEYLNCALATHVLAVSPTIRQEMIKNKIVSEKKSKCLGYGSICGIDLDEFKIEKFNRTEQINHRQKLGIGNDAFVVFYVGRPFIRKGFHVLLKAWQVFSDSQNKTEKVLFLAGCDLNDVISAAGFCPKGIIPLGYIENMEPYYAACDAVALPSFHEGMPYSLLEAAAARRTMIASDIPGIDSVVRHNINGLLVDVNSDQKLALAFEQLCTEPEFRNKLVENARLDIENKFDRKNITKLLINYNYSIGLKKK